MTRREAIFILAVVLVIAGYSLMRPYQIAGHSSYVDLSRAEAFHQNVLHGDLTPRWLPDFYFRFGSPIFNYYAPLTYYVIEIFRLVGLSGLWAVKVAYLFFWFAAMVAMYFLAAEIFDRHGALAAAVFYGVAPYLLVDAYVRVGLAEFSCFAFLPLLFLGLWRSARRVDLSGPLLAALTYAALTLAHNITALIVTPLALAFVPAVAIGRRAVLRAWSALFFGLALSAFFWLPALLEKNMVHSTSSLTGGFFDYHFHFLVLGQLFKRVWDFSPSIPGPQDRIGFMFGEGLWLAFLLAPVFIFRCARNKNYDLLWPTLAGMIGAGICLFMTLPQSSRVWDRLPLISFVQFPWRFLLPATFFGALLAAALPLNLPRRWRLAAVLSLVLLAVAASGQYFRVRYVFQDMERKTFVIAEPSMAHAAVLDPKLVSPDRYLTIDEIRKLGVTSTASDDYLPMTCTKPPTAVPAQAVEPIGGEAKVISSTWGYPQVHAEVQASGFQDVAVNQFYFPGWQARLDGAKAPIKIEPQSGRMLVTLPPGRHFLELEFKDTSIRRWSKYISVAALAFLMLWLWIDLRKKG